MPTAAGPASDGAAGTSDTGYNTKEYRYARGMTEATEPVGTVLGLCYGRVSTREQADSAPDAA